MPSEFLYQTGPHTCQSFELSIFLIFEDIEFVFLLLARASVLVIYTTHHHIYTGARFLPRLSWHIVRLSCQFRLMSLTCPPGIWWVTHIFYLLSIFFRIPYILVYTRAPPAIIRYNHINWIDFNLSICPAQSMITVPVYIV